MTNLVAVLLQIENTQRERKKSALPFFEQGAFSGNFGCLLLALLRVKPAVKALEVFTNDLKKFKLNLF
jgi:hypothetical protein